MVRSADGRIRPLLEEAKPGRHTAMHGTDRSIMNWYQVWAVGFGISMILSSGCRSGESWAPSLPKFGGSNLVFGSKPKEAIDPPALSFKPSEPNPSASSRTSTQLAANTAIEGSRSSGSSSNSSPPRAPYSFQESNNSSSSDVTPPPASSVANTLPTSPRTSPPASVLGQLPPLPGGIGQVGYERSESPRSEINPQSAPLNSSVVNSPLLPSGQNSLDQREIRSIPGGSLGNPLGSNVGNNIGNPVPGLNSSEGTSAGLPSLPPAPASSSGLPSPMSSLSSLPVAGLPTAASPASIPAAPLSAAPTFPAPGSSNLTSPGLPMPGAESSGPLPGNSSTLATTPSNSSSPGTRFRPGSVGGGQSSTTPNYRQTQHGAYPGLPAWPGSTAAPAAVPATLPAGANQTLPSAPTFGPSGGGVPTSLPALGQPSASGSSALPSFPVSGQTSGQLVCDGDQCVIR